MGTSSIFPPTTTHPANPAHPACEEYLDVVVMDGHRRLEDGNDPAVRAWRDAQNRRTRNHLDAIADRTDILSRLTSLFSQATPSSNELC